MKYRKGSQLVPVGRRKVSANKRGVWNDRHYPVSTRFTFLRSHGVRNNHAARARAALNVQRSLPSRFSLANIRGAYNHKQPLSVLRPYVKTIGKYLAKPLGMLFRARQRIRKRTAVRSLHFARNKMLPPDVVRKVYGYL